MLKKEKKTIDFDNKPFTWIKTISFTNKLYSYEIKLHRKSKNFLVGKSCYFTPVTITLNFLIVLLY